MKNQRIKRGKGDAEPEVARRARGREGVELELVDGD
jgi:hypothetical protein